MEGLRKQRKISVRICGAPAKIRVKHLPNKSTERYRYTNLLGLYIYIYIYIYVDKGLYYEEMTAPQGLKHDV
jgi:hypothetical protein